MVAVNGSCCCSSSGCRRSPSGASSVQHQPLWLRNDSIHIVFFMSSAQFSFGFGLIDFLSTQLMNAVFYLFIYLFFTAESQMSIVVCPWPWVVRSPCSLQYHTTIAQLWPKSKRCDSDGWPVWSVIQGCATIFLYWGEKNDNLFLTWRNESRWACDMFWKVLGRSCYGGGLKYASSPARFKQKWGCRLPLHLKK